MIHPKQLLVLIACSAIAYTGRSQSLKRGLIAKAANKADSSENPNRYEILILNPTDSIAYITHSYSTLLIEGVLTPDVNLLTPVSYKKDTATYALYYSQRDSEYDHPGYQQKLAAFLLPHQFMRFSVSLMKSSKHNQLMIEYILLPDFCYRAAIQETQQGGSWFKKYKNRFLEIPFERMKK